MNTGFKGTLGKIESVYTKLSDFTLCTVITGKRVIAHINSEDVTSEESKANAELFADAGNTIQSCGLLPSQLLAENKSIKDERESLIKAFSDVSKEFKGREWIKEGRGPYAYDDYEYRKEVTYLFEAFEKIKSEMWSNIQSKTFEYKNQIEEPLLKQNQEMREMLEAVKYQLDDDYQTLVEELIESTNP